MSKPATYLDSRWLGRSAALFQVVSNPPFAQIGTKSWCVFKRYRYRSELLESSSNRSMFKDSDKTGLTDMPQKRNESWPSQPVILPGYEEDMGVKLVGPLVRTCGSTFGRAHGPFPHSRPLSSLGLCTYRSPLAKNQPKKKLRK